MVRKRQQRVARNAAYEKRLAAQGGKDSKGFAHQMPTLPQIDMDDDDGKYGDADDDGKGLRARAAPIAGAGAGVGLPSVAYAYGGAGRAHSGYSEEGGVGYGGAYALARPGAPDLPPGSSAGPYGFLPHSASAGSSADLHRQPSYPPSTAAYGAYGHRQPSSHALDAYPTLPDLHDPNGYYHQYPPPQRTPSSNGACHAGPSAYAPSPAQQAFYQPPAAPSTNPYGSTAALLPAASRDFASSTSLASGGGGAWDRPPAPSGSTTAAYDLPARSTSVQPPPLASSADVEFDSRGFVNEKAGYHRP